jgi:uncharacterized protein
MSHSCSYLTGNAGNPLHRLPVFKQFLKAVEPRKTAIIAIAPRSYWSSSSRTPSERGLLADYNAALTLSLTKWGTSPKVVLYGHSLGGAVALRLLAQLSERPEDDTSQRIVGLILENPISSVPEMVQALYSSRWLPYYYLGPLVWDKWDAIGAIREDRRRNQSSLLQRLGRGALVLNSENDEIVPKEMGERIFEALEGEESGRVIIPGALHDNAWLRGSWGTRIKQYFQDIKNLFRV